MKRENNWSKKTSKNIEWKLHYKCISKRKYHSYQVKIKFIYSYLPSGKINFATKHSCPYCKTIETLSTQHNHFLMCSHISANINLILNHITKCFYQTSMHQFLSKILTLTHIQLGPNVDSFVGNGKTVALSSWNNIISSWASTQYKFRTIPSAWESIKNKGTKEIKTLTRKDNSYNQGRSSVRAPTTLKFPRELKIT